MNSFDIGSPDDTSTFIEAGIHLSEHDDLSINLTPVLNPDAVKALWVQACRVFPSSFFQSWNWFSHFAVLGEDTPYLVQICHDDAIAGLAWGYIQEDKNSAFGKKNWLHLHHSGDSVRDKVYPEYAGLLCFPDHVPFLYSTLLKGVFDNPNLVPGRAIAGVVFAGLPQRDYMAVCEANLSTAIKATEPCYGVDLVPDTAGWSGCGGEKSSLTLSESVLAPYVKTLGKSTRTQIRRSLRKLQEVGPVAIVRPSGSHEAMHQFKQMSVWHNAKWNKEGKKGAFENKQFTKFHKRLITSSEYTDILSLQVGSEVIGSIYNFLYNGKVYYYQSGFNFDFQKKTNPGLLLHAAAICLYSGERYLHYDFMAGEARYKANLGKATEHLFWATVQPKNFVSEFKRKLSELKEILRH